MLTDVAEITEALPEAPAAAAPLSYEVFHDFAGVEHLRAAWDDAVARTGGSVYMTYDWARLWWSFYGRSAALRLFVFSAGGRIVAILPLYIDTIGWGPLRLRVARLVGANIPPKVFSPPVPAWCAREVFEQALPALFARDRCDLLSLGPVSDEEHWKESVPGFCQSRPDIVASCTAAKGVHSVFHLPADMEAYYASLSKNERKNRRKYELRLLGKEHDTRVDVIKEPAGASAEFERFAEQHRRQWLAEGKSGHFGAWPDALAFNRALVAAQAKAGRVRFIRIVADGEVVASQYTFAFAGRYYWELPARAIEPRWDRFSLGPSGIVTMLAQGIEEGVTRVEGGLAHYDYKVRLGAKEYATWTYRVVPAGSATRVRVALFSIARTALSLAYHKVWYRRVMPRLPRFLWRPQTRLWLALDF
jgi:CelD/BcsL family acetyltransferase involved in cellulose biosynthesis